MSGKPGQRSTKLVAPPANAHPGDPVDFMAQGDGRRTFVRACKAAEAAINADLGGAAELSYLMRSLVRQYVFWETWLAMQQVRLPTKLKDDVELTKLCQQVTNTMQQLSARIGTKRRAKDVPDLQTYLRQKAAENAQEATDA